jgi:hypothetical protein
LSVPNGSVPNLNIYHRGKQAMQQLTAAEVALVGGGEYASLGDAMAEGAIFGGMVGLVVGGPAGMLAGAADGAAAGGIAYGIQLLRKML